MVMIQRQGNGVLYEVERDNCEQVLKRKGFPALYYHWLLKVKSNLNNCSESPALHQHQRQIKCP